MSNNSFKIEGFDQTISFMLLFGIGLQHYVAARIVLKNGLVNSGILLAQQCIEALIKAIFRLNHKYPAGHHLVELIHLQREEIPYFKKISEDDGIIDFLSNLHKAYKHMRYGEAKSSTNTDFVVNMLDELAFNLKNTYTEIIKAPVNLIYVPTRFREDFLAKNKFFKIADTTNNPIAIYGMAGVNLPDINNEK